MSIYKILEMACQMEASDVHLTYGSPIIFRIQGELRSVGSEELTDGEIKEYVKELVYHKGLIKDENEIRDLKEIDFSFDLDPINRFRVNIFRQRGFFSIAARAIPSDIPHLSTLNLPDYVKEFAKFKKGLVLVTGPTGSGKSTTLAALLNIINEQRACHIITLEDPIEFIHKNKKSIVNQREIGKDSSSFQAGLRAAMRQDPDVILVGEMRDFETIQTAITAAETGHLVFATLHTVSAPKTIDRIIDVFPPHQQNQIRVQLADTLKGVIAQQLVPTIDKRRAAAVELLTVTTAVKNLIREGKTYQIKSSIETGSKFGMTSMTNSLRQLMYQGTISEDVFIDYNLSE